MRRTATTNDPSHVFFEAHVVPHLSMLRKRAIKLTRGDASSAEDLMQETLILVLRHFRTYADIKQGALPWLYTILRNAHFSRSKRVQKRTSRENDYGTTMETRMRQDSATTSCPEARLDDYEVCMRVRDAVAHLPEHISGAIRLIELEGRSGKEAARRLGCSPGAARTRNCRGRKLLMKSLPAELVACN